MIELKDGLLVVTLDWQAFKLGVAAVSGIVIAASLIRWVNHVNAMRRDIAAIDSELRAERTERRKLADEVAGWNSVLRMRFPDERG